MNGREKGQPQPAAPHPLVFVWSVSGRRQTYCCAGTPSSALLHSADRTINLKTDHRPGYICLNTGEPGYGVSASFTWSWAGRRCGKAGKNPSFTIFPHSQHRCWFSVIHSQHFTSLPSPASTSETKYC